MLETFKEYNSRNFDTEEFQVCMLLQNNRERYFVQRTFHMEGQFILIQTYSEIKVFFY